VLDSAGNPVDGSTVSLLSEKSSVRTDVNGRARLTSLTPGQHVVEATPPRITAGGQTTTVDVTAGKRTDVTIRFDRVGTVSGTILNQKGEAISNAVISINDRRALTNNDGKFQFDARFAAGRSYIIDVTRDGDSLYKQNISIEPGSNEVQITVSTDDSSGGWQLVNNANKGAVLGEVGVQMNVPGSRTLEYHAGWLGLSMVPVLDAPADIRDCLLAPNDNIATNSLDCGGAAASTIGSAGTVLGVVTSPSGAGVAVAGGSLTLDTAEDVTDVVKVVVSASKYVDKGVIKIAELLISKVGDQVSRVIDKIKNADIANRFRKAVGKINIVDSDIVARYSDESADLSGTYRIDAQSLRLKKASDFAEIAAAHKIARSEGGRVASNFNGISDLDDGKYVLQGFDPKSNAINSGEIDVMVVTKNGNNIKINHIIEVKRVNKKQRVANKGPGQLAKKSASVEKHANKYPNKAPDLNVEAAGDIRTSMYVPRGAGKQIYDKGKYANKDVSVKQVVNNKGHKLKEFGRTEDQIEASYKLATE
jgi:hypothetical protein